VEICFCLKGPVTKSGKTDAELKEEEELKIIIGSS
jgi:hypothetical protein